MFWKRLRIRRIIDMKAEATREQWYRDKEKELLETVREFVLSRRDDIEQDIEDFGMLKPVLEYFLEARGEQSTTSQQVGRLVIPSFVSRARPQGGDGRR